MLKQRVLTALALVGGLLLALFQLPFAWVASLFLVVVALGGWEWAGLLKMGPGARRGYALALLLPCIALWWAQMPMPFLQAVFFLSLGFWCLVVPVWFRRKWLLKNDLTGWFIGGLLLIPSWAGMVLLQQQGPKTLLAAMAVVWVADIAAYFTGRLFGRHKLAPQISPGKTWEGAAGAVVGVLAYGLTLAFVSGRADHWQAAQWGLAVAILLVLTILSIAGDLFESLAKRQAGLKDSGRLLPGHGGVLDRIDSLTATLPLAALLATAFP